MYIGYILTLYETSFPRKKFLYLEDFFFIKENFVSVVCNYRVSPNFFLSLFLFYLWVGFPRMMTANLRAKKRASQFFCGVDFSLHLTSLIFVHIKEESSINRVRERKWERIFLKLTKNDWSFPSFTKCYGGDNQKNQGWKWRTRMLLEQ